MHEMHLDHEPFELIKNGKKTIELRLNDEKRQLLQVGETLLFTDRKTNEELKTRIVALHHYPTFALLYPHFSKEALGYLPCEDADPKDMEVYYPLEQQQKYGILGIEIALI